MHTNLPANTQIVQFRGAPNPILFQNADPVAQAVRTIMALWPEQEPDFSAQAITVTGENGRYSVGSLWMDNALEGLEEVAAACGAIVDTAQSTVDANRDWLCLHGAAFEVGGQLVVLTGQARMGKSTLTTRMAAEDVRIYCDDMLPVIAPHNHGLALGIPPRPRLPLPQGSGETLARHLAHHTAARDSRYGYLDTTNLAAHGQTAPIGAVILLDRRADGPAGFTPANRAEALKALFLRNIARSAPTQAIADRLEALIGTVPCIKMHYSDLDAAAALLMARFGQWPANQQDLLADPTAPGTPLPETSAKDGARLAPGVDPDALYAREPGVSLRTHDGEGFLFDAAGIQALHLNPLAHSVWMLLDEPLSVRAIADMLAVAFPQTDATAILADVGVLIAHMEAHGVVVKPHV